MRLFVAFGIVALFIATLGVYAVTSYRVSQRRREMNIRLALGATTRQVIGTVISQGLASIAVGVATGVALAIGSLVASWLFDVPPPEPFVIGAAVAVITA